MCPENYGNPFLFTIFTCLPIIIMGWTIGLIMLILAKIFPNWYYNRDQKEIMQILIAPCGCGVWLIVGYICW